MYQLIPQHHQLAAQATAGQAGVRMAPAPYQVGCPSKCTQVEIENERRAMTRVSFMFAKRV
jgi:hypothetical protein